MRNAAYKTLSKKKPSKLKLSPWLWRVLADWFIIALCFTASHSIFVSTLPIGVKICAVFPLIIVIGARQHALAILGHDGAHRLITRHPLLNDLLTRLLCVYPLGMNLGGYRNFHFSHHRTVGTPADPELIHKNHRYRLLGIPVWAQWSAPTRIWQLCLSVLGDFLGGSIPHLGMAMYLTRKSSLIEKVAPIFFIGGVTLLCFWLKALWIVGLWFGCLVTSYWAMFRLRIWTEHVGTRHTQLVTANFWQRFLFLPHNTDHHFEHHGHPTAPFWALPKIRESYESFISATHVGALFKSTLFKKRKLSVLKPK